MKILIALSLFIIGLIVTVRTKNPEAAKEHPYTGAAETVVGAIGEDIRRETSEGMREASALPNPRDPITAKSPEQPSASGTTTKSDESPAWVNTENLGGKKFRWDASPAGAPKTQTRGKLNLRANVDGNTGGIILLTTADKKNIGVMYLPSTTTDPKPAHQLLDEAGRTIKILTSTEEAGIMAGATAMGFKPLSGQKIEAWITFETD